MKALIASVVVVGLLALTAIVSFRLGAQTNRAEHRAGLASVQAALGFNHLRRYREIEADLSKGCSREALEWVRFSIDQETRLLSEYYEKHNDPGLSVYISKRDPMLLTQLKSFKSKYVGSWIQPQCLK
jgi:hypothetical protein